MASTRGNVFMMGLAIAPPATVLAAYLLRLSIVVNASIVSKTLWSLGYVFVCYNVVLKWFTSPLRHFPTPPNPHPILGHGKVLLERPPGTSHLKWTKEVPNDGIIAIPGFFYLDRGLLCTTPETVMQVLNAHTYDWEKPALARKFLSRVLGNGMINVEGNEHKYQRKHVTPAFSGRNIKDLVPLFWKKSWSLADAVGREAAQDPSRAIEIGQLASRVTLDIIGAAAIGKDFLTTENAEDELALQYARITDPNKGFLPLYFVINLLLPGSVIRKLPVEANRRVQNAIFTLRRIVKELLGEKKVNMEEKTVQKDIIATLIRGGRFDDDRLTDQLLTFLAAGHETTASAITWAMYLLCKHNDVQDRLRKEVQEACGSSGRDDEVTAETIESLPFLDAVCSETLRIYPTVPITARRAVRQTQIGDHVIPKGSFAVICPWAINRTPTLWGPDAEEFRPERWLGAEGKYGGAKSPYAFITFLHGPRSCIGQSFARYELKCLLAVLLLRFQFMLKKPDEVPMPDGTVTIKPKDAMELIVSEI